MSGVLTRSKAAAAAAAANRHPQAVEAFKEGLGSVLRQWTALELAVFHQWGGPDSKQRAEGLQQELLDLFLGSDDVYKDDISLILEDYLEQEFNTICEDGSPEELGEMFCLMWGKCCAGDFTMVTDVLAREYVRHEMVSKSQGLSGGDADSDDEEVGDNGEAMIADAMETIQEEETAMQEEEAPPLVDPDGWEVVSRKNNKKKKGYKI
jgi:pre-rRNA-processing protein TSR2